MASTILMSISKDERERAIFRSRRKRQTDNDSNIATAEDRGRLKERFEIARNAVQMKMIINDIMKLTGLTREEIENLK